MTNISKWQVVKEDKLSKTFSNGSELVRIPLSLINDLCYDMIENFKLETIDNDF